MIKLYCNKKGEDNMTIIGEKFKVLVTNPIGSQLDTNNNIVFKVNYGIVDGVLDANGEPQYAYILGEEKPLDVFEGHLVAIVHRLNDFENKWIISNYHLSKEEIYNQISFIEGFFNVEIIL